MQNQNGDPGSERLTIEEIYRRYPDEWVLVSDYVSDDSLNVLSGRVVYHSKDRDDFDAALLKSDEHRFAIEFTGGPPEGMEFALSPYFIEPIDGFRP